MMDLRAGIGPRLSSDEINIEDLMETSSSDFLAAEFNVDDGLSLEALGITGDCCEIPADELAELMEFKSDRSI